MKFSKGEIVCREDLAYPEGALVCDGYDGTGLLLAHPLGGGFQLTVPAPDEPRFRVVAEAERRASLFRRGRFALADSEETFEGWANGQLWSGWEMPRFERTVAERLLMWLGEQRAWFDRKRDVFVAVSQDGEEEVWSAEAIVVTDGSRIKAYPVGAGAWTWEEA